MAKLIISAHINKIMSPPEPYLAIQVDDLDMEKFEKTKSWLRAQDAYCYNCVPPEQTELGTLTSDFYDMGIARKFIDFLEKEIGVPYTAIGQFASKVTKVSQYMGRVG